MTTKPEITADAVSLQERDEFREAGWLKAIAPAKVNLHLAIGPRRADGYHEATSIMHALALHDTVYLRESSVYRINIVAGQGISVPDIAPEDNLATEAVAKLAEALGKPDAATRLEIRIEKSIPVQAGLGGGSSDAAAALVAAASLWNVPADSPTIEAIARELGADVAFFLHGGCTRLEGAGDAFAASLEPSRQAVVLVKPEGGISTDEAYRAFDERPDPVPDAAASAAATAQSADELAPFNNLAPAAERLMPELAEVRSWLEAQQGTQATLLCGSGAATFATCEDFSAAARIAATASAHGWWSRATSFSAIRAAVAPSRNTVGTS